MTGDPELPPDALAAVVKQLVLKSLYVKSTISFGVDGQTSVVWSIAIHSRDPTSQNSKVRVILEVQYDSFSPASFLGVRSDKEKSVPYDANFYSNFCEV